LIRGAVEQRFWVGVSNWDIPRLLKLLERVGDSTSWLSKAFHDCTASSKRVKKGEIRSSVIKILVMVSAVLELDAMKAGRLIS